MSIAGSRRYDAVVVGAGPNGLASAITLARAGLSTLLVERSEAPGGGVRSSALTLPGFVHDDCSAVHPLGIGSPFFRTLGLERHGLEWIESPTPVVHVMGDGTATPLERSLDATAEELGPDGPPYRRLMEPFVHDFDPLMRMLLGPLRFPRRPVLMARFGLVAIRSMCGLARARFRGERAPALLGGMASHAMVPLDSLTSASFALVLAMAGHAVGWPIPRGGSRSIANALVSYYRSLGGELVLGHEVTRLSELPEARVYLFDVSARHLVRIAGDVLSPRYKRRVERFRYGPGVFKADWALDAPIPWKDPRCARAVTVHLAGSLGQLAAAAAAVHAGQLADRPFVLLGQPSIVDETRAPDGKHTVWAYCHVPNGSDVDALGAMEAQIERFAPGFRDRVLARSTRNAVEMERYNPNYVGGDINGGLADWMQLFFRPVLKLDPYATSAPNVFICSSCTPPGGGVHGMCGYWAARRALGKRFGKKACPLA